MGLILILRTTLMVMFLNSQMGLFVNAGMTMNSNHRPKRSLETRRIATAYSQKSSCPFASNAIVCDPKNKYRSFDGTCNNLNNGLYGSVNTPYQRFLQPEYADGTDLPRVKTVTGKDSLPSPRVLSKSLFNRTALREDDWLLIYIHFGQFVAHDLSQNSLSSDSQGNTLDCTCDSTHADCNVIPIPTGDTSMSPSQQCIKFTRSTPSYQNLDCSSQTRREQLNMATAYLDLSHVYGISLGESNSLRTMSKGQMKTSDGVLPNRPYLPKASSSTCGTDAASNKPLNCFDGGSSDERLNSNMPLTIMHTLFLRQHNRIASNLALVNPQWNDQRLFDEARRILIATYQHMVYNEWVAATSGRFSQVYPTRNGYGTTYNKNLNAQIMNEFPAAVLRFGHTWIPESFNTGDSNMGWVWPEAQISLRSMNFNVKESYNTTNGRQGLEDILYGLLINKPPLSGLRMSDTFQNRLFPSLNDLNANAQVDMASINIQRGRDHGIPSYNKYREMCGFGLAKSFDDLNSTMWENTIALLKKSYADVNDIDLFVGGMAEATVDTWANFTLRQRSRSADASVGKTFRCLIEKQFELIKNSDRFWYDVKPDASVATDTTAFTLDQVNSIKDQSMSSLLCFNTNINKVRPRVFTGWGISHGSWSLFDNTAKNCSIFRDINYSLWKE